MSLSFFWLAVGAGLLALVTPCVFPLIPLTAAYFSDRDKSRSDSIRSGLFFVLGIIFTFTIIGLVVAVTIGASGLSRFASSASVNIALAFLFAIFGVALFSQRSLALPSSLVTSFTSFANRHNGRGVLGPVLLGALFAITSFTCTTPFVGTLLVLAARDQWLTPLAGMFVFSVVFSLPFFILAVAPGFTRQLPKSGPWLDTTKRLVGLVELAAAVKFAANADMVMRWGVIDRSVVVLSWVALVYMGFNMILAPRLRFAHRPFRVGFALAGFTGMFLVANYFQGHSAGSLEAFLPPRSFEAPAQVTAGGPVVVTTSGADSGWIMNDYNAALSLSRVTGKPVLVDFTGYTCTNCRWMEANIFARPEVKNTLGGFVLSRLYTDGEGEMYEKQQAFQERKFSTVALPLYAIVDANGNTIATFAGLTRSPAEFLAFLRKAGRPRT